MALGCAAGSLTACGGNTQGSPSTSAPLSPPAAEHKPTVKAATYRTVDIYFDGDSKTYGLTPYGGTLTCDDGQSTSGCTFNDYGHGVANASYAQSPSNEPARVLADMNAAFGTGAVTVENHGVPGATVLDSINGSADPISGDAEYDCSQTINATATCGPLGVRLQASHAQIVVGQFLTNDQYRMTPAAYQQYVATWISTVQGLRNADGNPMIAVWIETSPICRLDAPDVGPYLSADRAAATAANVMVIGNHDRVYADYPWLPATPDCVHASDDLYAYMGDNDANNLAYTVQRLLGR